MGQIKGSKQFAEVVVSYDVDDKAKSIEFSGKISLGGFPHPSYASMGSCTLDSKHPSPSLFGGFGSSISASVTLTADFNTKVISVEGYYTNDLLTIPINGTIDW